MAIVSSFVLIHSQEYLKDDKFSHYRKYFALLMLLITAITGVYFANNIAVTWILLETTTLCSAGILYHRHSEQTLEATGEISKFISMLSLYYSEEEAGRLDLESEEG